MTEEDRHVFAGYTELKIKGVYPSLREQGGVTDAECQKTESIRENPRFLPDQGIEAVGDWFRVIFLCFMQNKKKWQASSTSLSTQKSFNLLLGPLGGLSRVHLHRSAYFPSGSTCCLFKENSDRGDDDQPCW